MKIIKKSWQILLVNIKQIKLKLIYTLISFRVKWYEYKNFNYLDQIQKQDISPIFIVGSGRSGNTLLARILHESGDVCFPPENFTLWEVYILFLKNIEKSWNVKVDIILNKLLSQEDSYRWDKISIDELKKELYESNEQTLGNIIDKWYMNYTNNIGYKTERWGCKTPNITPYLSNFKKIFPNLQVVYIYRKPSDVVKSFIKTSIESYNDKYMAISLWKLFNDYMKKILNSANVIVDYDDLIKDIDNKKNKIYKILNIRKIKDVKFDNPDTNYKHLNNVNSEIKKNEYNKSDDDEVYYYYDLYYEKNIKRLKNV